MRIFSWGSNSHGQLGQDIQTEQILIPTEIDITVEVKQITGGGKHSVILLANSEILMCGDNDKGQLGNECTKTLLHKFQFISCPVKVIKVSCGWDFNLALTDSSEVYGWGSNSFGQLGIPVVKVSYLNVPSKIFNKKALDIAAGLRHSGVVTSTGFVYTAGFGRKGQLGVEIKENTQSISEQFTPVQNIKNCRKISCGEHHCVAETGDKEFYSWGNNRYGQLGLDPNSVAFSFTPIKIDVPDFNKTKFLLSGWTHNLILSEAGQVISWGRNNFGQLGEPRTLSWKPQKVQNIDSIKQISVGSHHSFALTIRGKLLTWGWNEHGNCGNNCCENVFQPYELPISYSEVKLIGSGAAHSFFCF